MPTVAVASMARYQQGLRRIKSTSIETNNAADVAALSPQGARFNVLLLAFLASVTLTSQADALTTIQHPQQRGHARMISQYNGRIISGRSIMAPSQSKKAIKSTTFVHKTTTCLFATTTATPRPPSLVSDPDGPTPVMDATNVETIDVNDIDELREISDPSELPYPIPYQPWRRGDTAGCEEPIAAPWRKAAEDEIVKAVSVVGGRVLDVTWYLTTVLVTLDEDSMPEPDMLKDRGPVVEIVEPAAPVYMDPADPEPDEIWHDEEDFLYERETEEEAAASAERLHNMYATVSPDDEYPDEPRVPIEAIPNEVPLFRSKETRDEVAFMVTEEMQERHADSQQPIDIDSIKIDTSVLSTIANAIVQALQYHEEEWRILRRHELVLSSPNPAVDCLETQRQFDAYRNTKVIVETQDPFESNRTLRGKLVDRNAMDLILNIRGRMVTVPHNFIKCVRLAQPGTVVPDYNDLVETEYIEEGMDEEEDFDEDEDFDDE